MNKYILIIALAVTTFITTGFTKEINTKKAH